MDNPLSRPPMIDLPDTKSFWDLASPQQAAQALQDWFGDYAVIVAADLASATEREGLDEDRRFWIAVQERLS